MKYHMNHDSKLGSIYHPPFKHVKYLSITSRDCEVSMIFTSNYPQCIKHNYWSSTNSWNLSIIRSNRHSSLTIINHLYKHLINHHLRIINVHHQSRGWHCWVSAAGTRPRWYRCRGQHPCLATVLCGSKVTQLITSVATVPLNKNCAVVIDGRILTNKSRAPM